MKRQALVNSILETMGGKLQTEIGSLLGCQLTLSKPAISSVSKEDFFSQSLKKLAMARISAEGDKSGECFIFTQVKDAVLLGGTLIMLPPAELEQRMAADAFEGEEADAFGEIANIIAGVLTTTFDEYFPDKLRFVKKELETVVPTKVTAESSQPFPDGIFCQAVYNPNMDGQVLSPLQILFPAELLGLSPEVTAAVAAEVPPQEAPSPARKVAPGAANQAAGLTEFFAEESPAGSSLPPVAEAREEVPASGPARSSRPPSPARSPEGETPSPAPAEADGVAEPTVLLLAEDEDEWGSFATVLQERGYRVENLAQKEDLRRALAGDAVKGVFLVMREVSEQGFAAAIRIKSAGGTTVPLIAAGPQWTRKTVLQAVKYGICDIVMTPATPQEIREKIDRHLLQEGV